MKRIGFIAIAFLMLVSTTSTFAQKVKLGYVKVNEIIKIMPERTKAQKQITEYSKQMEQQLQTMNKEFEKKYQNYEQNYETWSKAVRKDKEMEIQSLQQRIQEFQRSAQEDLKSKEQELLQPIYDKINKAINTVGDENGYTYIYDDSTLLYKSDDANNLTDDVKKQLGL